MMNGRTKAVVVDLDNTLYDWVAFYVPALESMVNSVADRLHVSAEAVFDQLRDVYRRHDSLEYAFAVQALEATRSLAQEEVTEIVTVARKAFAEARDEHLRPYSGVPETLSAMHQAGVSVIAASNAPLFQAQRRLRHLGVIDYFDGIAARSSFEVPTTDAAISDVAERSQRGGYDCQIPLQWQMDEADLKPSPAMYTRILHELQIRPDEALVVGDSLAKDVMPALRLGVRGAWARYGTTPPEHLLRVLLRVTPWSPSAVAAQYAADPVSVPTIDRFGDVLELL